jgi:hypothetical protein
MSTVALLILAVATVAPPDDAPRDAGVPLLRPAPPPTCLAKADEIVVCGKDANGYRLPQLAPQPDITGPPRAEWRLPGGAKAGINTQQRNVGGYPSNAVMATITIPF